MKHKTAELTGPLLDAAVAKAEWPEGVQAARVILEGNPFKYEPSTDWAIGGSIIEREGLELFCIARSGMRMGEWQSRAPRRQVMVERPRLVPGPTPLVAAMRAYVMAKLGEEVELP